MKLDLVALKQMHPLLPATTAAEYGHRAAVGLERHGHGPGVSMDTQIDAEARDVRLEWQRSPWALQEEHLDRQRVTEDAAECIALALVHVARGWVVRRRLQRGESADWLLHDAASRPIALEVSGLDRGDHARRLREKLEQVRRTPVEAGKAACVVQLAQPLAALATA